MILRKHLSVGTCFSAALPVPLGRDGSWSLERGFRGHKCCKWLTGFGLVLGHLGEDLKKPGFALGWMLAGVEGDSWIGISALFS